MSTLVDSKLSLLDYFIIADYNDIAKLKISNYFFKNQEFRLDLIIPYPISNCSLTFDEWKYCFWGSNSNPKLFSITKNESSILLAFSTPQTDILKDNYAQLWSSIITNYFEVSTFHLSTLQVSNLSLLTHEKWQSNFN